MNCKVAIFLALLSVVSCQLVLLSPPGRGFIGENARHAPCGIVPTSAGNTVAWEQGTVREIEVQILGAGGGGVIEDRYSCVLQGGESNPIQPLFPIEGALKVQVPDWDFQIYRLHVRLPSFVCRGDTTMQLIYSTEKGQEYFQCQDIVLTYSASSTLVASLVASIIFVVLVVL